MTLDQVFKLIDEARARTKHRDFVIVGSHAALGLAEHAKIPKDMAMSMDLDCYLRDDPDRTAQSAKDLANDLGEGSEFHAREGFYLDVVSPWLPTLPEGWESRLLTIERNGTRAWFIDPDDAAISKYARGEPRDQRWSRAGLDAGLISMPKVQARLARTGFLDAAEEQIARRRIEDDARWLEALRSKRPAPERDEFLPP